ncbi:hypothetical protein P3L10_010852 [Capsicum annuum]
MDGYEGHNEIMVGKVLKQLPHEQVQMVTKFGCIFSRDLHDLQFQVRHSTICVAML